MQHASSTLPCSNWFWGLPRSISNEICGESGWRMKKNHSRPSSAEVKNVWSTTSAPSYLSTECSLIKQRDSFTLGFTHVRNSVTFRGLLDSNDQKDVNSLPLILNLITTGVRFPRKETKQIPDYTAHKHPNAFSFALTNSRFLLNCSSC